MSARHYNFQDLLVVQHKYCLGSALNNNDLLQAGVV